MGCKDAYQYDEYLATEFTIDIQCTWMVWLIDEGCWVWMNYFLAFHWSSCSSKTVISVICNYMDLALRLTAGSSVIKSTKVRLTGTYQSPMVGRFGVPISVWLRAVFGASLLSCWLWANEHAAPFMQQPFLFISQYRVFSRLGRAFIWEELWAKGQLSSSLQLLQYLHILVFLIPVRSFSWKVSW